MLADGKMIVYLYPPDLVTVNFSGPLKPALAIKAALQSRGMDTSKPYKQTKKETIAPNVERTRWVGERLRITA